MPTVPAGLVHAAGQPNPAAAAADPSTADPEAAAMQHQQLATGVLPAPEQGLALDNSSSGAASAPPDAAAGRDSGIATGHDSIDEAGPAPAPAAGDLKAQTATAGAAERPAATCPDAQAAATWRTAAAGTAVPAPAAAPESGLISALAAIIRQQDLEQQQQQQEGLSTGAADAGAASLPACMGFRAPAVAASPAGGVLQGSRSSSQPLTCPADLLNLLLGLGGGTATPQAVAPASAALAAAGALSAGTAAWPQQQGQQMISSLPGSAQGAFPAALAAAPAGLPGASSARRGAGPPSSLAVAAALAALGPAGVPQAAPAAPAAAAGLSAARPMGAHALMKRKASGSLPSSPVVLSTYNSPRGLAGSGADAAAGGSSGCAGNAGCSVRMGQMPGMQLPPHPRRWFSGSAYEAGSGPAAAVVADSTAAAAAGRTRAVGSVLQEPQTWTESAAAAAGAGGNGLRGFPTNATRDAEAEGCEEDLDDLLLQATAAALHVSKAPAGSRGWVGRLGGKGRAGALQMAAAAGGEDDMEVDVSPTMAAAAAAMSGLARLGSSGLGGGSAAGRLRSKAAAASAAAAAQGGPASAKKKAAAHSRKAMRFDAGASGGSSGGGAAGGMLGAHQDPSAADAAAAAAALTAVATAGMLAGSLNWSHQWYGGSSNQSAAAAAAGQGEGAGLFAGSGYGWGGLMPGSWQQDNPVGTVPWPAQLAAGQQVVHKPRGQSAGGKAAGEPPKPRAPRAKKEASDPSYVPQRAASPTAAVKGGPGSRGGAGAPAAAAAEAADTAVGGKKKCKSSTSHFRGVTQHRYTLRWEAHLWDPDAIRSKTAGSARTKGKQTYLGGYPSEAEAAHAYDRAALVYWGDGSITNYPKEAYAGEMHLLAALTREQVVLNIRAISHANQKFAPQRPGVFPHQALPGIFEARLYDAARITYQYLGAYASEEAASEAVAEALKQQQQAFAAAQAAVEAVAAEAAGIAHTGVADAMTAADAPS